MKNARSSSFSVSFSRFARRPPGLPRGLPQRRSFQAAYAIISAFTPVVNPPFFQLPNHYIFPSTSAKPPVYRGFGPFCLAFAWNLGLLRVLDIHSFSSAALAGQEQRLRLFSPERRLRRLGDEGEVRHQRIGLAIKSSCRKGTKKMCFIASSAPMLAALRPRPSLVETARSHCAVAQVRFDRHGRRRVAGAARQLGQRVALCRGATSTRSSSFFGPIGSTSAMCARSRGPQISRRARAHGRGAAKARVEGVGIFRHDGKQLRARRAQRLESAKRLGKCAERAGHAPADARASEVSPSLISSLAQFFK